MKIGQRGIALVIKHKGFTAFGRVFPESYSVPYIETDSELDKEKLLNAMQGRRYHNEIHREVLDVEYTGGGDWKFVK